MAAAGIDVIYTDIARDGMLSGPDLAGRAAQAAGARVIVSGGVPAPATSVPRARPGWPAPSWGAPCTRGGSRWRRRSRPLGGMR